MVKDPVIWTVDIGSICKGQKNFGWCRLVSPKEHTECQGDDKAIRQVAKGIAEDLCSGKKVSLGIECPLFIPVREDPCALIKQRDGEKGRSWSAGAGPAALVTGLAECIWIFREIKRSCPDLKPTFECKEFKEGNANLFIWEAFVSRKEKESSHAEDAKEVASEFYERWSKNNLESDVAKSEKEVFSLIGAVLLYLGLVSDPGILHQKCLVIEPKEKSNENSETDPAK